MNHDNSAVGTAVGSAAALSQLATIQLASLDDGWPAGLVGLECKFMQKRANSLSLRIKIIIVLASRGLGLVAIPSASLKQQRTS
jgi:hypothetical protein